MKLLIGIIFLALVSCGSPETPKAYVTSQKGGITVIDLTTKEVINEIDIQSSGPRGIGVSSDGKYLVTANKDSNKFWIFTHLDLTDYFSRYSINNG